MNKITEDDILKMLKEVSPQINTTGDYTCINLNGVAAVFSTKELNDKLKNVK